MFFRIKTAMDAGKPFVAIMPNPWPGYLKLAAMLNRAKVDCRKLHTFNMDEYADQDGRIAPETWEFGFGHAFKKYFWSRLEPKLRPPEKQIRVFSDKNLSSYGRMLSDLGGCRHPATAAPAGPAISPSSSRTRRSSPARSRNGRKWAPRICTLSPFTIAQNSLHGCFGCSGDLTAVPPKAATIGPAEGHRRQAPHRPAHHHGRRLVRLVAAPDFAPRAARSRDAPRSRVHPPNVAHRRLGLRIHRRQHRDPLGQGLLNTRHFPLRSAGRPERSSVHFSPYGGHEPPAERICCQPKPSTSAAHEQSLLRPSSPRLAHRRTALGGSAA